MRYFWRAIALALTWFLIAFFATLLIIASGCGGQMPTPIPPVDHVVTVTVKAPCAKRPPPDHTPVPRPSSCSPGFLCWTINDAVNLSDNVEALKEWVAETWPLCAPQK